MLEIIRGRDYVPVSQVCQILNNRTQNELGIFLSVDKILDFRIQCVQELRVLNQQFSEVVHSTELKATSPRDIKNILLNQFKIDPELITNHGKITVDKRIISEILDTDKISPETNEFLHLQQKISKFSHQYSQLKGFLQCPQLTKMLDHEGSRVINARPMWNILSTSRLSTSNPSFQNIAKEMISIITWLPGQIFIEADSSQIEPCITYSHYIKDPVIKQLILGYGDAYFALLMYVITPREEIVNWYKDPTSIPIQEITDEMRQMRKDLKVLSLASNYGGEESVNRFAIGPSFIARVKNHKQRIAIQEKAKAMVEAGQDTCYSAFGTPITPEETDKYKKGSKSWYTHLERCFVNNPIQATAADLMNISVFNADKIIREQSHSQLTSIVGYVHDCGKFYLDEREAHLIDKLKGCMAYQVIEQDGEKWIPIKCDLKVNGVEVE